MSDTPRTDADDRPYPSPDYTQHINFEGCDSVVMPPEEYAALYEHARQLERELNEANAENTRLRAALATSKDPCVYCQLPKEEMVKCRSGFPGRGRADDLMGCPELGSALRVEELEHALSLVVQKCEYLHHPKKYQHKITEPCPVEELIRKAQNQ